MTRASHVEPTVIDGNVKCEADLSLVNGPKLDGFLSREEAIQAEVEWLNNHLSKISANEEIHGII